MLYTLPWSRCELTTSMVKDTDCIGSCKSNYHTITAMMAPIYIHIYLNWQNVVDCKQIVLKKNLHCIEWNWNNSVYFYQSLLRKNKFSQSLLSPFWPFLPKIRLLVQYTKMWFCKHYLFLLCRFSAHLAKRPSELLPSLGVRCLLTFHILIFTFETTWSNEPKLDKKILYKDCSVCPNPLTNMAAIGNSCFWLVDF
jgi:hypothetical protein